MAQNQTKKGTNIKLNSVSRALINLFLAKFKLGKKSESQNIIKKTPKTLNVSAANISSIKNYLDGLVVTRKINLNEWCQIMKKTEL